MKKKKLNILNLLLSVFLTSASLYAAYSIYILKGIENLIRLIIIIILIIIMIIINIVINKPKKKKKKIKITPLIIIIYSLILFIIGFYINKTYNIVSNISSNYTTYSSSLITLSTNNVDSIKNIDNGIIGMIDEKDNSAGYIIPQETIKEHKLKNEVKLYSSYTEVIDALYKNEINYAFLPSNYLSIFKNLDADKYKNIASETKIINTKEKKDENKITNKNLINEPFTVLLMGVDSENETIKGSSFNGDALVLLTFNPKTMNATMLSIPRDTYVPITCFSNKRKNKITHAAWYGESCMMNTIENFTGIDIDYYVKINFKGVVKLVDNLGGIELDVPYSFCEQNSNREFGNSTIYVEKGLQTLNGEQTLALARNRHPWPEYCSNKWTNYTSNDFVRGQNQQAIIKAILNKVKAVNSIDSLYTILDTISNNLETNMSTNEILSLYNVAKDVFIKSKNNNLDNIINIQRLYLSGYDAMIFDYSTLNNQGSQLLLYNFVPYQGSINDISKAMKINLGLQTPEIIKNAKFSINEPYEEKIIGQGYYTDYSVSLLPSFVGKDISVAKSYCNSNNIALNIVYESIEDSSHFVGEILSQSVPSKVDIAYLNKNTGITFTVVDKINSSNDKDIEDNEDDEDDENNETNNDDENNDIEESENNNNSEDNDININDDESSTTNNQDENNDDNSQANNNNSSQNENNLSTSNNESNNDNNE